MLTAIIIDMIYVCAAAKADALQRDIDAANATLRQLPADEQAAVLSKPPVFRVGLDEQITRVMCEMDGLVLNEEVKGKNMQQANDLRMHRKTLISRCMRSPVLYRTTAKSARGFL
jgi:hypothetical protein